MNWKKMITVYGVHCEGEVGRVITGGFVDIPGKTILDKLNNINQRDDWIRRFILHEPHGSAQMSANLLLPPVSEKADAAFIVLQPQKAYAVSGSNTMCVTTALLETGMLPMEEPETRLTLETAAGLVPVKAHCKAGKVESVTIDMVPSFVEHLDFKVQTEAFGELIVDVGFGGCYFAMVDVSQLDIKIRPVDSRKMVEYGSLIKKAVDQQVRVQHPGIKEFNKVDYVMFTDKSGARENVYRNGTIIYPGRVDRSPCGTGSSCRLAIMAAKGEIAQKDTAWMESVIGGRFKVEISETRQMEDNRQAVIPRLTGRCWIYSLESHGLDPSDPFPAGYTMADTWGPDAG